MKVENSWKIKRRKYIHVCIVESFIHVHVHVHVGNLLQVMVHKQEQSHITYLEDLNLLTILTMS